MLSIYAFLALLVGIHLHIHGINGAELPPNNQLLTLWSYRVSSSNELFNYLSYSLVHLNFFHLGSNVVTLYFLMLTLLKNIKASLILCWSVY